MNSPCLMGLLPVAALAVALPATVLAECQVSGEITRVELRPSTSPSVIHVQTSGSLAPTPVVYRFTTNDLAMKAQLPGPGSRATVTGSATTCPTTGLPRQAGSLTLIVRNP